MTAVEKIVERIELDAKAEAEAIIAEAEQKALKIKFDSKNEATMAAENFKAEADKKAERIVAAAESAANLTVRNELLYKRREEIEKTLKELEEHLKSLPEKKYFDKLMLLAVDSANGKQGVLYMNSADLKRVPQTFKEILSSKGIAVSDKADDTISGGFILKYDDIEINEDFTALIADKKEQLEDIINSCLF